MSNHKLTLAVILTAAVALTTTFGVASAQTAPTVDSMTVIKNQITANLVDPALPAEVHRENIDQALHLVFGRPVILDTTTVPDTETISDDYDMMVGELTRALTDCTEMHCSDPEVAAYAKNVKDQLVTWMEVKQNIEAQTGDPACLSIDPTTCPQLDRPEEATTSGVILTVGTDGIWDGWHRELRTPWYPIYPYPHGFVHEENVIVAPGPIADGECSAVLKEIQGMKSILRPTWIPIYQEPWTSRATIVGWDVVWIIEFVPAEFVKTLKVCNTAGTLSTTYEIDVIIERELLHFWKYLPGGFQPGGAVPPGLR